jgi:hypothetical protein
VRAAQANPAAWSVSDSLSIVLPPLEIVRLLIGSWDINICMYGMYNLLYVHLSIFKLRELDLINLESINRMQLKS